MRKLLGIAGFALIVAYAAYGALLMNNWAVVAASGAPLDETITAMADKDQDYSSLGGWVFVAIGIALAVSWLALALSSRHQWPAWAAVGSWSLIVAMGAPAYFFGSFANLNSVGDTFFDWNSEAAFSLEAPLYAASALAFALLVAMGAVGIWAAFTRRQRPLHPAGS